MRQPLLFAAGAALLVLSAAPANAAGDYGYCQRHAQAVAAHWVPPAPASAFAGGAAGAIGGAVFGGILGGNKGAGTGALIGAGIGAIAGASDAERKHRRVYNEAFRACMANHHYR